MTRQLEIGPGRERLPGQWTTVDCAPREAVVDVVCQWGAQRLPFPDESFDLVHAAHVLEHVPWHQTLDALREAWRVLRPGGRLEIHVPDFDVLMQAARHECVLDNHAEQELNADLHWMHWVSERLFHFGEERELHKACFNRRHLAWCLAEAGFEGLEELASERGRSHGVINLGLSASKPSGNRPSPNSPRESTMPAHPPVPDSADDPGRHEQLPYCHSRRAYARETSVYFCAHPRVHREGCLVTPPICRGCDYASGPPPVTFRDYATHAGVVREGPCWHLGKQVGHRPCATCRGEVQLKVFECHHADHELTTIPDCGRCPDYDQRLKTGRVVTWMVGVTTAPRRRPTLERCLDSLRRAGWENPWIFAEPGVDIPPRFAKLSVSVRARPLGAWRNWWLALTELFQRDERADAYLLIQDDVVFCRELRTYLETVLWPAPNLAAVSLYSPSARNTLTGFDRLTAATLPGALALVLPNVAARMLLGDEQLLTHGRRQPPRLSALIDVAVGDWARRAGLPIFLHEPSLAQHIGDTSTLWHEAPASAPRRSEHFVGEEFDARIWLAGVGPEASDARCAFTALNSSQYPQERQEPC